MAVQAVMIQDKCEDCQAPPQQTEVYNAEIEDWRQPYIDYLHHERLPLNRQDALKIQKKSGWGLDIIGPIKPTSSGRHKYIITATEYSTKWVEAIPLRDYSGATIAAFIKAYIICRFGAPMIIRSDNGTSFVNQTFIDLLDQYGIKFHTSTVYYPQGKGQAEATNKTLLRILSWTVYDHHRSWHEQLLLALWAYRISKRSSTGASPYSLMYGEDAILPEEIAIPSARVAMASLTTPDEFSRLAHLDTLEERRVKAERFADKYRQRTTRYYNQKVKERVFIVNEVVMKIAPHVQRNEKAGKFASNWQGPYMISEAAESRYYYLKRMNGSRINTPINGKWLKTYYA
ncbi:protein NYNRIN-like [Papaver somniferum]|uniref:protein NYNRIN-like n=1 Tax=Papaver somniferum TaxID=3469 RepID=UPI000E6F74D6|nr:protein NYNRIN-like [Papaver somniferum]